MDIKWNDMNEGRMKRSITYKENLLHAHGTMGHLVSELKIFPPPPPAAPPPRGGLLRSAGMGHMRDMPRRREEGKLARRDLDLRGSYGWSV